MADENVCPTTCGVHGLELDCELWKHFPPELLDSALCKLPIVRLLEFRAVSKNWCSILVPVAASQVQASRSNCRRPVLLLFGHDRYKKKPVSSASWLPLSNRVGIQNPRTFEVASFPRPRPDEYVRLLASEEGLLFFGFISIQGGMVRDFVACNPLTGQSKALRMPCPILSSTRDSGYGKHYILVGVALDVGSYQLVVSGIEGSWPWATHVYNSSTGTWTTYPSPLTVEATRFEEITLEVKRSIHCKGNVYWLTSNCLGITVLKFDLGVHIWTKIELPEEVLCRHTVNGLQMVLCREELSLWHIHDRALPHRRAECLGCDDRSCRANDCETWTSNEKARVDQLLHPELKLLSNDMIAGIEERLDFDGSKFSDMRRDSYLGLGHGDMIYHIMGYFPSIGNEFFLKIVTQEVNDISHPIIFSKSEKGVRLDQVWVFLPSLNSVP